MGQSATTHEKKVRGRCVHHPEVEAEAGCRVCGDFLCASCRDAGEDGICSRCIARRVGEGVAHNWERSPDASSFFRALGAIISAPGEFFRGLPRDTGGWRAYLHAVGVVLLAALGATLVNYLFGPAEVGEAARQAWLTNLWLVPLNLAGLLVVILLDAVVCFGALRFYDREAAFPSALRLVSYATAAYVFYPLPGIGLPIAVLFSLVLLGIGVRQCYGLAIPRCVLVAIIPLLLRLGVVLAVSGERLLGG